MCVFIHVCIYTCVFIHVYLYMCVYTCSGETTAPAKVLWDRCSGVAALYIASL